MPYALSIQRRSGKNVYCMTNAKGKTYCYPSKEARRKGMQMHEKFAHMKNGKANT